MSHIFINNEPKEIEIPATRETFEAQVLVVTKPYKKTVYPIAIDPYYPLQETMRVLQSGKYRVELVQSAIANGKPTLIITEAGNEE